MSDPSGISYRVLEPERYETIRPLWEELKRFHAELPTPFAEQIAQSAFEPRMQGLLLKQESGQLRIEAAYANGREAPVAYCVTSVSSAGVGVLDSLFVSADYRRRGIASTLVERALNWLDEAGASSRRVIVLCENDEAFAFYRRFGFRPRNVELQITEPRS
jgi:diamine N-acetyltransferase